MKLFLDDVRTVSESTHGTEWKEWLLVGTVDECKRLLDTGDVTHISLDYDLSYSDYAHTGMDVIEYIGDKMLADPTYKLPVIYIHSVHDKARKMWERVNALQAMQKIREG